MTTELATTAAGILKQVSEKQTELGESEAKVDRGVDVHRESIIYTLPPPPAFNLNIQALTIGVPRQEHYLPLPVPIPIPKIFIKENENISRKKYIIENVSLSCGSGEVLAIIGGSGSGKSTLLSAIVGRLANLPISAGEVQFSSAAGSSTGEQQAFRPDDMKERIGFVPQNDFLLPNLTVRETLHYAASLRLPSSVSAEIRRLIVEQTLEELGLGDVANTVVGGFGALRKGISGGERRRTSIACILVALPSIIVLDEPTSGLDAYSAYQLLLTLSALAKRNRTIILSLHQPRSDAFNLFDRMVVLTKGSVAFSGPTSKCLPWFSSLGLEPEPHVNPLDFLIDISSLDIIEEDKKEAVQAQVERILLAWKTDGHEFTKISPSQALVAPVDNSEVQDKVVQGGLKSLFSKEINPLQGPGFWAQTRILTSRANKNTLRNYAQTIGYTGQAVIIGLVVGLSYFRLGESPTDIQSLKTICFQHIASYFYLTVVYGTFRYCSELIIFDREREDNLYGVGPWILSEILANLSINIAFPALFALLLYFLCGFRTDNMAQNLFIIMAECALVQLGSLSFALIATSLVRDFANAGLMANGTSIFFILSAGYALVQPPVYVRWVRYISVYWYGFRIMSISQFRDRIFSCEGVTGIALNQCQGNQVLAGLLIPSSDPLYKYFGGLVGLFIGFNIIAGIILTFWKPGGVQHAAQIESNIGKTSLPGSDMDIIRRHIDVDIKSLCLSWKKKAIPGIMAAQQKLILDDITFSCPSSQITAIVGPSGAGKSSILQLIAKRAMKAGPLATFESSGSIMFDGSVLASRNSDVLSYVEQEDDYHLPALTVRETIRYAAILCLPRIMSRKRKIARAEEIIHMLGLEDCANNLVGGPLLKGISGGEKRRLSLAVGMLNDPAVLIVDEVTTGLDAATANNVMRVLKSIAQSGRTVIVTLHQPRSDIYQLLDNVVVLAKGGRVVYAGAREQVESIFNLQNLQIPEHFNHADWLLDQVSVDHRLAFEEASRSKVDGLVTFWKSYERKFYDDLEQRNQSSGVLQTPQTTEDRLTPMWIAIPIILDRAFRNMWRQQPVFWVRIQQTPLMGALFLLFYQRLKSGPTGGQDRIGYAQQILGAIPYVGLLNSVAIFPVERNLFLHEYETSAAYSAATFTIATTILETPFTFISCLLLGLLMNLGGGMTTSPRIYFEFVASTFAAQSMGESIGIVFAAFTSSMGLSVSLVSTVLSIMTQFSGLVSLSVPYWLQVIAWASPIKPAARIVIINEASGLHLNCSPEQIQSGECLIQTGQDLINLFGWRDLNTEKFVGFMLTCCVIYRLLGWCALMAKIRGW